MPVLASLGKASNENVYLRVRDGMESETVAIFQTDPSLRVYTEVGKRLPLHADVARPAVDGVADHHIEAILLRIREELREAGTFRDLVGVCAHALVGDALQQA